MENIMKIFKASVLAIGLGMTLTGMSASGTEKVAENNIENQSDYVLSSGHSKKYDHMYSICISGGYASEFSSAIAKEYEEFFKAEEDDTYAFFKAFSLLYDKPENISSETIEMLCNEYESQRKLDKNEEYSRIYAVFSVIYGKNKEDAERCMSIYNQCKTKGENDIYAVNFARYIALTISEDTADKMAKRNVEEQKNSLDDEINLMIYGKYIDYNISEPDVKGFISKIRDAYEKDKSKTIDYYVLLNKYLEKYKNIEVAGRLVEAYLKEKVINPDKGFVSLYGLSKESLRKSRYEGKNLDVYDKYHDKLDNNYLDMLIRQVDECNLNEELTDICANIYSYCQTNKKDRMYVNVAIYYGKATKSFSESKKIADLYEKKFKDEKSLRKIISNLNKYLQYKMIFEDKDDDYIENFIYYVEKQCNGEFAKKLADKIELLTKKKGKSLAYARAYVLYSNIMDIEDNEVLDRLAKNFEGEIKKSNELNEEFALMKIYVEYRKYPFVDKMTNHYMKLKNKGMLFDYDAYAKAYFACEDVNISAWTKFVEDFKKGMYLRHSEQGSLLYAILVNNGTYPLRKIEEVVRKYEENLLWNGKSYYFSMAYAIYCLKGLPEERSNEYAEWFEEGKTKYEFSNFAAFNYANDKAIGDLGLYNKSENKALEKENLCREGFGNVPMRTYLRYVERYGGEMARERAAIYEFLRKKLAESAFSVYRYDSTIKDGAIEKGIDFYMREKGKYIGLERYLLDLTSVYVQKIYEGKSHRYAYVCATASVNNILPSFIYELAEKLDKEYASVNIFDGFYQIINRTKERPKYCIGKDKDQLYRIIYSNAWIHQYERPEEIAGLVCETAKVLDKDMKYYFINDILYYINARPSLEFLREIIGQYRENYLRLKRTKGESFNEELRLISYCKCLKISDMQINQICKIFMCLRSQYRYANEDFEYVFVCARFLSDFFSSDYVRNIELAEKVAKMYQVLCKNCDNYDKDEKTDIKLERYYISTAYSVYYNYDFTLIDESSIDTLLKLPISMGMTNVFDIARLVQRNSIIASRIDEFCKNLREEFEKSNNYVSSYFRALVRTGGIVTWMPKGIEEPILDIATREYCYKIENRERVDYCEAAAIFKLIALKNGLEERIKCGRIEEYGRCYETMMNGNEYCPRGYIDEYFYYLFNYHDDYEKAACFANEVYHKREDIQQLGIDKVREECACKVDEIFSEPECKRMKMI